MSRRKKGVDARLRNRVVFHELRALGIKYLDMNMLDGMKRIAEAYGLKIPTSKKGPALRSFLDELKQRKPSCSISRLPAASKIPRSVAYEKRIADFYNSWEWQRLSYQTKLQRGRRCECCGAMPPAIRIVTDHIKPIRHHWHLRFDASNLQVLCDECNRGKASRDETDFRHIVDDGVINFPNVKEIG